MVTLSKKSKIIITTISAIAIILAIAIPLAGAETITNNAASNIRTLTANGKIYQTIDSNTIKYYSATLTLTLQPTKTDGNIKKLVVTSCTLVANGVTYTFASGNGGVSKGRNIVLLQAEGTGTDGQAVTLKLAGRYCYSWLDNQVVIKIGAKLLTPTDNYNLLMKSTIPT